MMSVTVTREMAERASKLAEPTIKAMQADGIAKRDHGYMAIGTGGPNKALTVFVGQKFGEPDDWEFPYADIAVKKYMITHEHGMSTREVHEQHPELVDSLQTPYKGSAINKRYGIIVAFSGVDEYIDEAIAELVLAILVGLVRDAEVKTKVKAQQQLATSD